MKLYPITNGTPDNSLEFFAKLPSDGSCALEDIEGLVPHVCEILGTNEHVGRNRCEPWRITIFGPAFKALCREVCRIEPDDPHAALKWGKKVTARELCLWLEEQLNGPTVGRDTQQEKTT